jgi:sialic acid synthase SpsE
VPSGSRARGVKLIEKHFTLSQKDFGPDHPASIEPDELAQMVISIDEVGRSLGSSEKIVSPVEMEQRKVFRKSIVAASEIKSGTILSRRMLATKRPGYGIPPKDIESIVGYTTLRDIYEDEVIMWDMIKPPSHKNVADAN